MTNVTDYIGIHMMENAPNKISYQSISSMGVFVWVHDAIELNKAEQYIYRFGPKIKPQYQWNATERMVQLYMRKVS